MKLSMTVLCVIIVVIVPAAGVFAYPVDVGDSITLQNGPGNTGGGEFEVWLNGSHIFNTFCVETNEYISFNTPYLVYSITDTAIAGGTGGSDGTSDPLDPKTAYLYYNFAMGTLAGYNYSGTDAQRAASADALQRAIWYIEDERGSGYGEFNDFVQLAYDADWQDIGNVRVMNLVVVNPTTGSVSLKQDQLTLVPEPCTLLLLGAGLIGVGLLRKRFKR